MNVDLIFKIAGLGVVISVMGIVLKQAHKEEQAQMLTLAGVVVVLLVVVKMVIELFTEVRTVFNLY